MLLDYGEPRRTRLDRIISGPTRMTAIPPVTMRVMAAPVSVPKFTVPKESMPMSSLSITVKVDRIPGSKAFCDLRTVRGGEYIHRDRIGLRRVHICGGNLPQPRFWLTP